MSALMNIEQFAPGYCKLTTQEIEAIYSFTLMWTLFEGQILNTAASAKKIAEKAGEWQDQGYLEDMWFEPQLEYFKARYIENGAPSQRFGHLHLRTNDCPDLVKSVLLGNGATPAEKLSAILIIVLRLRNNFFHGLKWAYQIKEQQNNFEHASQLLQGCLSLGKK